jgi:hypothetical protein
MRINFDKWNHIDEACDFDRLVMTRDLTFNYKRLDINRYSKLIRGVREYNDKLRFIHGRDRNGNPYRCGCMHDCCGCIVEARIYWKFMEETKTIKLIYIETYNY